MEAIKDNKKIIRAWTFYDWANSVYPLVVTTAVFPIFYAALTAEYDDVTGELIRDQVQFFGASISNTVLFSYVTSFSFLIVAFISPILSGIADYTDSKKSFLKFFCYLGALACMSLFFFDPNYMELSMLSIVFAGVGFWASLVFYNAYLPEIADKDKHDLVSARGFAMGYIGSAILLIIVLGVLMGVKTDGEGKMLIMRSSFVLTGLWWIGFSQLTYAHLPNAVHNRKPEGNRFTKGWRELKKVWDELKDLKRLKRYLGAFFVFSMGVQTVMLMAVLFAEKEINWVGDGAREGLIISVLIIQFIAIPGSYFISWLSKKKGNLFALTVCLIVWVGICISALFIFEPSGFYVIAAVVGFVMGGIQALSRSTYSKLLPETMDNASFFSFYDVLEKIGIVIGTLSYGLIEQLTGSMRNSIFALIIFFLLGLILLLRVPKTEDLKGEQ